MATNDNNQEWFEKDLDQENLSRAEYLWNEFQYRHDLIWNLVFRLTIAVVLLGIIPYTQSDLIEMLGELSWWILAPPLLGAVLASIGFKRIRHELKHLNYIWCHYRALQDRLIGPFPPKSTFPRDITIYTVTLTGLAGLNLLFAFIFTSCGFKSPPSWCSYLPWFLGV
jgi:hypothetical protein